MTARVPGCASLVHHVRIPCAIHKRTKCDGRAPSRSGGTRTTCVYARASRVVTLPLRQARRGTADLPARWRPWTGWPEAAGRRRSAPAQGRRRRRWRRRPQIRCRRRRSSIQKMATKHQILIAKGSREDDPASRPDECTHSEPPFPLNRRKSRCCCACWAVADCYTEPSLASRPIEAGARKNLVEGREDRPTAGVCGPLPPPPSSALSGSCAGVPRRRHD